MFSGGRSCITDSGFAVWTGALFRASTGNVALKIRFVASDRVPGSFFRDYVQYCANIRAKKLFEIVWRLGRQKPAVRFYLSPIGRRGTQTRGHRCEVKAKVFFLNGQWAFQDPLKQLLMALFKRLLDGFSAVDGGQPGVFVNIATQVSKRSHINEPRKRTGEYCQARRRKILDDPAILLELCQCTHDSGIYTRNQNRGPQGVLRSRTKYSRDEDDQGAIVRHRTSCAPAGQSGRQAFAVFASAFTTGLVYQLRTYMLRYATSVCA